MEKSDVYVSITYGLNYLLSNLSAEAIRSPETGS